jgi:lysosomal alpha-glucosidase
MWNTIAQEPYALGDTVLAASLASLKQRYTILPYLYSAFVSANISGETVARPLFFEYPQDVRTFELDTQFLLGPAFMVSPVLDPGVDNVSTYVPNDDWYL